jgi:hypothetical protein
MTFVRSIGRWTMAALVINCIIGGEYSVCPVNSRVFLDELARSR